MKHQVSSVQAGAPFTGHYRLPVLVGSFKTRTCRAAGNLSPVVALPAGRCEPRRPGWVSG